MRYAVSLFVCLSPTLFAIPEGSSSFNGQITQTANSLEISTQDHRSVIDWNTFSIDIGESVKFQQPAMTSAVLNRVMSQEISQLLGTLQSNGQVFLINPNGVIIGKDAQINTAGFFASTYPVGDFLKEGDLLFQGDSTASIVHLGNISAPNGNVALIAHKVKVNGDITGQTVSLVSGHEVLLKPSGDTILHIRPDLKGDGIENHGTIQALQTLIQTDGAHSLGINQTGSIKALKIENIGGKILLKADNSTLTVSGELDGTTIHLLGDKVHLENQAIIDASGDFGGGEILVGGDFQGSNPNILNATETFVGADVQLKADATKNGDGGKIILWSDELTFAYGKISAKGGDQGGDGGFVEVSGKMLEYRGLTNASAPLGKTGTLLLDPNDIVIGAIATTGTFSACAPPVTYNVVAGTATNQILNTDLNNQLSNCSVTISTVGSGGAGPNAGSITVSSPVSWNTPNTLTLNADAFISITSSITNTSASTGFTAISLSNNAIPAAVYDGITVSGAAGQLATSGGNIILNGKGSSANGSGITISATTVGGAITTGNGNVTLTGIAAGSSGTFYGVGIGVSTNSTGIQVTGSGNITFTGCSGGGAGTSSNKGVGIGSFSPAFDTTVSSASGSIFFGLSGAGNGITGGTGSGGNCFGLSIAGATTNTLVSAPTIIGTNITGGNGAGTTNHGFYFDVGTIGSSSTNTISFTATGAPTATGSHYGIAINSSGSVHTSTAFSVNTGGSITLNGTGGGTGAATFNFGILFNDNAVSFTGTSPTITLTGVGGVGTGSSGIRLQALSSGPFTSFNFGSSNVTFLNCTGVQENGVVFSSTGPVTTTGTLSFTNCTGDGTGNGVSATIGTNAATISFSNCQGGSTSGRGASVGALTATNGSISFQNCFGGGTGNGVNTTALTASGPITFNNCVGGAGSGAIGLNITGNLSASSITGTNLIGGASTGGNHGMALSATLGTASTTSISITAVGGGDASVSGSHGISVTGAGNRFVVGNGGTITLNGTGTLSGTGANGSFGLSLLRGAIVGATSSIISLTGIGGAGTSGNHGINLTLGTTGTTFSPGSGTPITFTGQGGGASSVSSHGVQFLTSGATPQINAVGAGTITFSNCIGGTGAAGGNGVNLTTAANFSTGTGNITFSGCSGNGTTGSNYGIFLNGTGTISASSSGNLIFQNCSGGGSGTSGNGGVTIQQRIFSTAGSIQFNTIYGGTGNSTGGTGDSAWGVFLAPSSPINAPTISATNVHGSLTGSANCYGFILNSGTLGATNTTTLSISATGGGSLGLTEGFNNFGISINGALIAGGTSGAAVALTGIGGGNSGASGTGGINDGISVTGTLTIGNVGDTLPSSIILSGTGGLGNNNAVNNGNTGVNLKAGSTITLSGGSSLIISNAQGGTGTGGSNYGATIASTISTTGLGSLSFYNITGGSGGSNNYGLFINGTSITAPSISGLNIFGGSGTNNNHGLFVSGNATLGNSSTTYLSFQAKGGGNNSLNHGIYTAGSPSATLQVGSTGTILLNGSGGGDGSGGNNYGLALQTTSLIAGSSATISLTGSGGTGTAGNNVGIYVAPDTTGIAQIIGIDGNITLTALNSSIFLGNGALVQANNGNILALADLNIVTTGSATMQTTGSGNITLVVDNAYPTSPNVGNGLFNIPSLTFLTNGALKLYGGVPNTGIFPTTLNGATYTPGLYQQNNVWYPGGSYPAGSPYFIYYKKDMTPSVTASLIQRALFNFRAAIAEPFQTWDFIWYGSGYLSNDAYTPALTPKHLNMILPSLVYTQPD